MFAFEDGIYDMSKRIFYRYDATTIPLASNKICAKYIGHVFDQSTKPERFNRTQYFMDIHTNLDNYIVHNPAEARRWFWALLGCSIVANNTDNWDVIPCFHWRNASEPRYILNYIGKIYVSDNPIHAIYTNKNAPKSKNAISTQKGLVEEYEEIEELKIVEGEKPYIFSEVCEQNEKKTVRFELGLGDGEPTLLDSEIPLVIRKAVEAYYWLHENENVNRENIWEKLPIYFHKRRDEFMKK